MRLRRLPLVGEGEGEVTFIFVRVGTCADELRLMGVVREEVLPKWGSTGGGWGSVARNVYSANVQPCMKRICGGPWGDEANCTIQFVVRGGRLRQRRVALGSRLTKRTVVGIVTGPLRQGL